LMSLRRLAPDDPAVLVDLDALLGFHGFVRPADELWAVVDLDHDKIHRLVVSLGLHLQRDVRQDFPLVEELPLLHCPPAAGACRPEGNRLEPALALRTFDRHRSSDISLRSMRIFRFCQTESDKSIHELVLSNLIRTEKRIKGDISFGACYQHYPVKASSRSRASAFDYEGRVGCSSPTKGALKDGGKQVWIPSMHAG